MLFVIIHFYVSQILFELLFLIVFCLFFLFYRTTGVLLLHALNHAFAEIPIGIHTLWACIASSIVCGLLSFILRRVVSTIVPFETIFVATMTFVFTDILYGMIKFIPIKDEQTGVTKRWAIGTWLHMPASHRFDLKARAAVKRGLNTTYVLHTFAFEVF